jgi:ATP-dependent DNA helicase RecG
MMVRKTDLNSFWRTSFVNVPNDGDQKAPATFRASRRQVVGCSLGQKTLDKIARAGHDTDVDVQAHALVVDGRELTIVAVPEVRDRIVTTTDGRLLRRVGSDNQPLRGDALGRFVREREERSGEDEPIARLDYVDLNLELINRALVSDGRPLIRRRAVGMLSRALADLGVAEVADASLDPQVLRAAVLLFANEPTRYVKAAAVQVVRRVGVGPGPVSAREDIDGPIPILLDRTLVRQMLDDLVRGRQAHAEGRTRARRYYP